MLYFYRKFSSGITASLVFFVGKKDGSKRMVMDYCNLNNQMVKNNYPLPLIMDLIDNMGSKKIFTKMDLRWGFNNMRIKEEDEWKGVFTTHMGSFEPTVMFFEITNLPAMFQAMMNEILRDLINEGKVVVFVDDVLVGTETEEGHNETVEEILKRLKENNLYVKPEKYMWKVRKIGFLEVVIEPNRIEMEKENVRGQHLGSCLVSPVSSYLLEALYLFVYCISIVLSFFCLYHAVRCLLFYLRTIVITNPCAYDCLWDCLV